MSETKLDPFQIADNVFMKRGLLDPVAVGYDPFMMGKICANNADTVFFAAELNRFPNLSKRMSYNFYYHALDKGKRYGKWRKSKKDEEVATIAKAFGVSKRRASEYHKILGTSGVKEVVENQYKGGRKK